MHGISGTAFHKGALLTIATPTYNLGHFLDLNLVRLREELHSLPPDMQHLVNV